MRKYPDDGTSAGSPQQLSEEMTLAGWVLYYSTCCSRTSAPHVRLVAAAQLDGWEDRTQTPGSRRRAGERARRRRSPYVQGDRRREAKDRRSSWRPPSLNLYSQPSAGSATALEFRSRSDCRIASRGKALGADDGNTFVPTRSLFRTIDRGKSPRSPRRYFGIG